jgi:steroid 5-alpha reductase family enzyme
MNFYLLMAAILFSYMSLWYIVSIVLKRNDVADIAWGFGFVVLAWTSLVISGLSTRGFIVALLVTIWGVRLSSHIYARNKNKPEDFRYQQWRKEWKFFYVRSFLQIYLLQGVFLYLISLPFLFINELSLPGFELLDLVGMIVWTLGFYFESRGDRELKQFVSNPENKGKTLNQGLWKYSRHPNYFGEVTQWWGIFIMTLSIPNGYLTIIGPLTITMLILFISGIPLLEKKREGNPAWEEYKKKTSIFIPLPPRKKLHYS